MATVREMYPGLTKAALEMAYDNGAINRFRTERGMLQSLAAFLKKQNVLILADIDKWLTGLCSEQLSIVCCGEHEEVNALITKAPPLTDTVLDGIFDEVL